MATNVKTQRDTTIDTVKCLLIFSIFVFHYGTAAGRWYSFFGAFHVPAFFMVSGFWAMNRLDRSVWSFLKNATQKYLIHWLVWVCIYPIFYMAVKGYGIATGWRLFVTYLCAVRESGIAGMWFVPAFFLVTLCYFLVAKGLAKCSWLTPQQQAVFHCGIALLVYLVYFLTVPQNKRMLFSVDQVPLHWFYYALGRVVYGWWLWLKEQRTALRRGVMIALAVISSSYMVLMFFGWDSYLWSNLKQIFPVLPATVGVVMALCGLFWVARVIRCGFLAYIGRSTLGLCLCELLAKYPVQAVFTRFGWTVSSPWIAFLCAAIALLFGCFVLVPIVDWCVNTAFNGFKPKVKQ
ncbi:MAG: acyltransferase [Clostridia bacterium]|nr:acyltransferase [Clostridia bacterium]